VAFSRCLEILFKNWKTSCHWLNVRFGTSAMHSHPEFFRPSRVRNYQNRRGPSAAWISSYESFLLYHFDVLDLLDPMLRSILARLCSSGNHIKFQVALERLHLCWGDIHETDPPDISVNFCKGTELGKSPLIQKHACSLKGPRASSHSLQSQKLLTLESTTDFVVPLLRQLPPLWLQSQPRASHSPVEQQKSRADLFRGFRDLLR
jgi:hypothetical protein